MARSTGEVAALLGTTEPRLNDLIRRGKMASPPVVSGRRAWSCHDIEAAARALGVQIDAGAPANEAQR